MRRRSKEEVFYSRYFLGNGIDIGGAPDPLSNFIPSFPLMTAVKTWDIEDGDAQFMEGVADETFDFVYSSHCLEHLPDARVALKNWLRILKTGGYLIVTVPDEDLYEKGIWPSRFNNDHKTSFTIFKNTKRLPRSVNILDLVQEFGDVIECEKLCLLRDFYDSNLTYEDQTLGQAECAIEFIWRKKTKIFSENFEKKISFLKNTDYSFGLNQLFNDKKLDSVVYEQCLSVLDSNPLNFSAYNELSHIFVMAGLYDEAEQVWNCCEEAMPGQHLPRLYKALFLISNGKFDEGFQLRERCITDERRTSVTVPHSYPRWTGEDLKGKSIVIWTEFGVW